MGRNHVVADIRRHRGNSHFIVELVHQFCSRLEGATTEWVVRPDQAHLLPSGPILLEADEFDASVASRLRERLIVNGRGEFDGSLWLLSYDNNVLQSAININHCCPK
jgi:hypothetical protein